MTGPESFWEDRSMIEFFFDCSSPWTWLAFHNIQPLARELGVTVRWRPVLVGGIFNAVNPSVYEFRERGVKPKQDYLKKDLQDWARQAQLTLKFPPTVFPVNSVKAMRGCIVLDAEGKLEPFATAVFEAYWSRDEDISQDTVLADLCGRVGVEPRRFFEGIAQPEVKAQLKANTDEVIARGGFGSPTIFVDGDDMYFGNDRLGLVRDAVLRRQQGAASKA
jgi:2-hydroxychromene-2-carboxylate isomerase